MNHSALVTKLQVLEMKQQGSVFILRGIMTDPQTENSSHVDAYLRVDQLLMGLGEKLNVRFAMLVDPTGTVLSRMGDFSSISRNEVGVQSGSSVSNIGNLIANNASATSALAAYLGEDTFGEQIMQGKNGTLYVESVGVNGTNGLLSLVFDRSVPVGKVKIDAKQAVKQINEILEHVKTLPMPTLHQDFAKGVDSLLDDLLG